MNVNDVIEELKDLSVDEMTTKYSKSQLQYFFRALYDIEPRSVYTKADLAYKCWSFIADDKRTKDLCKILKFLNGIVLLQRTSLGYRIVFKTVGKER